jgi:hypothetical protein
MAETSGKGSISHSIALLEQGDQEAAQVIGQRSLCLARSALQPGGAS